MLKNPVYLTIYPWIREKKIHAFLNGISSKWNTKSFVQVFYSDKSIPYRTTIVVTQHTALFLF